MKKRSNWALLWFFLGFGIFVFTRMSKLVPTIPIAILIAPIFILRFSRTQPVWRGNLLTLSGFYLSINIGLWWLYESSAVFNAIKILLLAILYALPFMIDRLMYEKVKKNSIRSGWTTLIFPIITTAIHFLSSLEGFFEGTVQIGKFVFGPIILQQFLSVFGICGFIFIASWFGATVNYLWDNKFNWKTNKRTVIPFIAIILLIFLFGAVKISLSNPKESTVKVAGIILQPEGDELPPMGEMWANKQTSPFQSTLAQIETLTKTASLKGAKIIAFQELAMIIDEDNEQRLREEFQRIAIENDVYLSISYADYVIDNKGNNIHLFISPNGEILLDYVKRYVSGIAELDIGEAGFFRKGPEVIQWADTPYGRIAISICRDLEMTNYIRQAGKAEVDIMLSSAFEFEQGLVIHSSYMRTIEYGFSLLRPAQHGISVAVDYNGRVLSQMNFTDPGDGIMYANLPTSGVNTFYTWFGDTLGWICVVGLFGLVSLNVFRCIKGKKETTDNKNEIEKR